MKYCRINTSKTKDISAYTLIIFEFLRLGVTYEATLGKHVGVLVGLGRLEINFILRFWDTGNKIWASQTSYDA